MNGSARIRWFGLLLAMLVGSAGFSAPFRHYAAFPGELKLFLGQQRQLDYTLPVHADITVDPSIVDINGSGGRPVRVDMRKPLSIRPLADGTARLQLKLFGTIPIKTVALNVVPELKVIPGGQTIGVKVKSDGIMVVGHHQVKTEDGGKVSPAQSAGIRLGDLIKSANGVRLREVDQMAKMVEKAGREGGTLKLVIERGDERFVKELKPVYDAEDRAWRLGLYIRDSAAGVGTLTFYAPEHGVYGALGHIITDMDTQAPIRVGEGQIVQSSVTSINKSSSGEPGEKRAHFVKEGKVLGTVERNTPFGIFGRMSELPTPYYDNKAIPVAFADEVKEGPAHILTVVDGEKVEKFDIMITRAMRQTEPATKGMIIRITDEKLLKRTGGIVQGMSGSPIIQNGKLVGAVTHVFVNDPSSGYACYIEWMLEDAGILPAREQRKLKAG